MARPRPAGKAEDTTTRRRILEKAREAFASLGFEGVTMVEVARRAGVGHPLVYYHFESLQKLWEAAVDSAFAEIGSPLRDAQVELEGLAPLERLRALLRRYVLFAARHREMQLIIARESAIDGARLDRLVARHIAPLHEALGGVLESAQREGLLKPLPIHHLVPMLNGAVLLFFGGAPLVRRIYDVDPMADENVAKHADVVVEVLLEGLRRREKEGS